MKDIKGYEGLYAVTEDGQIWSYRSKKFLKPNKNTSGYLYVILYKDENKKHYFIHRVVAENFIPNPENLLQVNHIDENKTNNAIENLEWCTPVYNTNYGTRNKRASRSKFIPVYCEELHKVFESAKTAAEELGIHRCNITSCCKGKRKTCGGYHWRYADE